MSELHSCLNSVQKRTKAKESGSEIQKNYFVVVEYDASKAMVVQNFN